MARPRSRMSRKQEKLAFRGLGRAENREKWFSEASDEQKTEKIDFRPWPKSKKQQKRRFGHGRKTKNGENCISATAETEKTPQTGFPTPWKREDRRLNRINNNGQETI